MKRRFLAASVLGVGVLTALALLAFVQPHRPHQPPPPQQPHNATSVPEPSSTLLLAGALGGIGALEWRRRQRAG
jgi:hypothetical protein